MPFEHDVRIGARPPEPAQAGSSEVVVVLMGRARDGGDAGNALTRA